MIKKLEQLIAVFYKSGPDRVVPVSFLDEIRTALLKRDAELDRLRAEGDALREAADRLERVVQEAR